MPKPSGHRGFFLELLCEGIAPVIGGGIGALAARPAGAAGGVVGAKALNYYGPRLLNKFADNLWAFLKSKSPEQQHGVINALSRIPNDEALRQATILVECHVPSASPQQKAMLVDALASIPATVRLSLRRPEDPKGLSIPPQTVFRNLDDVLRLLSPPPPRFRKGDRPLMGVDWELDECLGIGGFGEVWKARNFRFEGVSPVALKFCLDPDAKARLLGHEAKVLNDLMKHVPPEKAAKLGFVALRSTHLDHDPPFLAYDYISGGDLTKLIREKRVSNPLIALQVVCRLATIIGFAHRLKPSIVHLDLKPANILVQEKANGAFSLRISDFGIGQILAPKASATALPTQVRGAVTLGYASPQQVNGDPPNPRDDVYALGVIWYQLLTSALTIQFVLHDWRKIAEGKGLSVGALDLLESCIASDSQRRPWDAKILSDKLSELVSARKSEPLILLTSNPECKVEEPHHRSGENTNPERGSKDKDTEQPACDLSLLERISLLELGGRPYPLARRQTLVKVDLGLPISFLAIERRLVEELTPTGSTSGEIAASFAKKTGLLNEMIQEADGYLAPFSMPAAAITAPGLDFYAQKIDVVRNTLRQIMARAVHKFLCSFLNGLDQAVDRGTINVVQQPSAETLSIYSFEVGKVRVQEYLDCRMWNHGTTANIPVRAVLVTGRIPKLMKTHLQHCTGRMVREQVAEFSVVSENGSPPHIEGTSEQTSRLANCQWDAIILGHYSLVAWPSTELSEENAIRAVERTRRAAEFDVAAKDACDITSFWLTGVLSIILAIGVVWRVDYYRYQSDPVFQAKLELFDIQMRAYQSQSWWSRIWNSTPQPDSPNVPRFWWRALLFVIATGVLGLALFKVVQRICIIFWKWRNPPLAPPLGPMVVVEPDLKESPL